MKILVNLINLGFFFHRFQLYQREKLLKKLVPGIRSSKLTPLERRKKSERKQRKLYLFHTLTSTIAHCSVIALAPLSLRRDLISDSSTLKLLLYRLLNPEALVGLIGAILLIATAIYACRILGNLKLALSNESDSEKLKLQSSFVVIVMISLLLYFLVVIISQLLSAFFMKQESIYIHTTLRVFEMIHNVVILSILASPSLSLRAPFPSKTREITQDWLTSVLRDNGTIKSTTTVVAFSTESLYGGCHFKVARVHLTYSVEKPDDPHKTIIVKLLYWDKSLYERLVLYFKYLISSLDREAMYLASYRIESLFYKEQLDILHGFHTAEVYYNMEDVFNNRFGMMLQDLSKHYDGQPNGFNFNESKAILSCLAEFHALNRNKKFDRLDGWKYAGFWTGNKREATKKTVVTSWERVMMNFPDFHFKERFPCLGGLLEDKLSYIDSEFYNLSKEFQTLCHGDFKVSNLFIKKQTDEKDGKVYVIDFQWFGYGNGLVDAVYYLYTSVCSDDLSRIPELLNHYYKELQRFGVDDYDRYEFLHHANIVFVDFAVYIICSKWSTMTLNDFKQYEMKVKDGLHLRSTVHMEAILKETHRLVCDWSKRPSQIIPRKQLIKSNTTKKR